MTEKPKCRRMTWPCLALSAAALLGCQRQPATPVVASAPAPPVAAASGPVPVKQPAIEAATSVAPSPQPAPQVRAGEAPSPQPPPARPANPQARADAARAAWFQL